MTANFCKKHSKFNNDCLQCKAVKYSNLKNQLIHHLKHNEELLNEFIDLHDDLVFDFFESVFNKTK